MSTPYIRKGYTAVSPYLIVQNASGLLDFIKKVFGATEIIVMRTPDRQISHGSVTFSGAVVELSEATERWPAQPASLHVYVPDTDATYELALNTGATSLMSPADQFYGERSASVQDSWGNQWHIATMKEELSNEEISQRAPQ